MTNDNLGEGQPILFSKLYLFLNSKFPISFIFHTFLFLFLSLPLKKVGVAFSMKLVCRGKGIEIKLMAAVCSYHWVLRDLGFFQKACCLPKRIDSEFLQFLGEVTETPSPVLLEMLTSMLISEMPPPFRAATHVYVPKSVNFKSMMSKLVVPGETSGSV